MSESLAESLDRVGLGGGEVPQKFQVRGNPLTVWTYKGKSYFDGLFKMQDQEGFALAESLTLCKERGWAPCVEQFKADAFCAGWSAEKVNQFVANACADACVKNEWSA